MRKALLLFVTIIAALPGAAIEVPDSVPDISRALADTTRNITVRQPERLAERLMRQAETADKTTDRDNTADNAAPTARQRSRSGYRVEVYSDNNVRTAKVRAAAKKTQLQSRLPQFAVYLVFDAPYWRVRLGDFTTKAAAESALAEVKQAFPSFASELRVVRSAVNP